MFPFRDHNPSRRVPFVTWALIAANVLIFLTYGFDGNTRATANLFVTWGVQPIEITNGAAYPTLVTSMFLHAGWMHLLGNMLFLWVFGDNMEDQMGHVPFLGFYLLSGLAAAFAQIAPDPSSVVPMVGASGAIAGVMGGYLLLFPRAQVDVLLIIVIIIKVIPVPAWIVLGIWMALQVFNGAASDPTGGGVAYWAHAGGFVAGLLMTVPLWLRRGGPAFWRRADGHPPHPQTFEGRSRIPKVGRRY